MSKKCVKCGYVRQAGDAAPDQECPNCGVIYAKAEAIAAAKAVATQAKVATAPCRQCNYIRQATDIGPNYRCPKCGLVYGEEPSAGAFAENCDGSALNTPSVIAPSNTGNLKQILGIVGSAILFVGVFAPIVSAPVVGAMNYFQNGKGDGVIVLVLAVISFFLALTKNYKKLWITGIASISVLLFTFIRFQLKLSDIKSQMGSELEGNPFRGLADMAVASIQLQWGWALLVVGAVLVISSAAIKE